ncbi:MAG: hypothetical protein DRG11_00555 [Epsilonproteobacteria bacterium]|nr:MAG: hypothetical protein DRG11_00555 [Campylobacterota bacterium]
MTILYPQAYWLLFFVFVFVFMYRSKDTLKKLFSSKMFDNIIVGKDKNKLNFLWLILSMVFLIIAISSPVISKKPIKVPQQSEKFVVAFDISASMKVEDIFPNRLKFSKLKFSELLDNLKDERVSLFGFSSQAFLISASTGDYESLRLLSKNINQEYVSTSGSSIYELLKALKILKNSQTAVLVFTDGTDETNFDKSLKYAKQNNIKIYTYMIATRQGGTIPLKNNQQQKDQNGNLVVSSANDKIKNLSINSGGAYLRYSFEKNDIKKLFDNMRQKLQANKIKIKTIKQDMYLYQVPLGLSLVFFLLPFVGRVR